VRKSLVMCANSEINNLKTIKLHFLEGNLSVYTCTHGTSTQLSHVIIVCVRARRSSNGTGIRDIDGVETVSFLCQILLVYSNMFFFAYDQRFTTNTHS
jgi:hypothetical protein